MSSQQFNVLLGLLLAVVVLLVVTVTLLIGISGNVQHTRTQTDLIYQRLCGAGGCTM